MLSKEEIEKAKEKLSKFMNNEMQRDKLERDCRCGGWKIGDVYKHLELNPAIETLLQYINQLEQENNKQSKIIDEMAKEMYSNISMLEMAKIGQAINYDPRKMFAGISDEEAIDCIKQYFEKKVEEK